MTSLLRTNPKGTGLQYGETDREKPKEAHILKWELSIVWHEVRKEDEREFRNIAFNVFRPHHTPCTPTTNDEFNKALSESIELPSERMGWNQECFKPNCMCISGCAGKRYPYIKPIKKDEETQDELWNEVHENATHMKSLDYFMWVKSNFNLTRK
jgi:hypothetical protein